MPIDPLSATFAALADPTRRAILLRLADGETTVGELAEPFDMSLPAVTKHLRVLREAGLIRQTRRAQHRPCALQAAPLLGASNWIAQYRQHWEANLDRLDAYLHEIHPKPAAAKSRARKEKK